MTIAQMVLFLLLLALFALAYVIFWTGYAGYAASIRWMERCCRST